MPSPMTGPAGEYYVMCQLLRRGFIAALAPKGVPNADIIVSDDIGDRLFAIQVKTRTEKGTDGGWHLKAKHETLKSSSLFYCFVDFGKSFADPPATWVVPSSLVADTLAKAHQVWLATPGKNGLQRKGGDLRRFLPDYGRAKLSIGCDSGWLDKYREGWDLLPTN